MADSWQQIDDDGVMMDWSSADTIKLCDLWHPLNAIRRCLNEKQAATGTSATAAIDRLTDTYAAANTLHAAISAQITKFINHTDNSGDWNGKTNIPTWTVNTILSAIGDGARVTPVKLDALNTWLIQSRKILNLLKWVRSTTFSFVNHERRFGYSDQTGSPTRAGAYSIALGAYNANSWNTSSLDGVWCYTHMAFTNLFYCDIDSHRGILRFATNRSPSRQASMDIYLKGEIVSYSYSPNQYGNNSPLLDNSPDTFKISETLTESGDATQDTSKYEFDTPSSYDETNLPNGMISCKISAYDKTCAVFKFDGANGFKFKDW